MNATRRAALEAFVADFPGCYVRDRAMVAKDRRLKELRTKKHDHLAVVWDELGNAFVLTAKGQRLQLIGNEIKGR